MKLKVRLPLYFLIVVAILATLNSFFVLRTTEDRFRTFVFAGDSGKAEVYAGLLGDFYEEQGSWDNVQEFIMSLSTKVAENVDIGIFGKMHFHARSQYYQPMLRNLFSDRVVIADKNGVIIADSANKLIATVHPERHLSQGISIVTSTGKKGTVLIGSMVDSSLTDTDEHFLTSIKKSLIFSSLISVILALILGIILSLRISHPIARLSASAREISLGHRPPLVPIDGNDELSELSRTFNEMTEDLKKMDQIKKQVIADSAHELRTPVSLIQGTIEGMLDGILPIDKENLRSVLEEVNRLSRLIDTLRELELIDAGELSLSKNDVDLAHLVTKSISLFAPLAAEKSQTMTFEQNNIVSSTIFGDFLRLREVLDNLVSNAIKYTPKGGQIRIREEKAPKGFVRFSIDDSGPGIDEPERAHVFERFYRTDKSRSTDSGGRGLGLAISLEIIKAHGGSITVGASDLGGAKFTVDLPEKKQGL
ncbi:ATP-binding protein [uncultured Sphaerochaeta sp.]|uniref:sensor histidine kinase n=1 Tax=uncultured Sphaerochaeta sp. TaxID=886478 RepID=UPI002A0A819D|nr:ATP-binding protein [uncultured Sphaerochaeta sp.]